MEKYVMGVDIGGITCKLGRFDSAGNILDKWKINTEKGDQRRMCRNTQFVLVSLGNDAGMYGAVYAI